MIEISVEAHGAHRRSNNIVQTIWMLPGKHQGVYRSIASELLYRIKHPGALFR